jgi:Na+-translocating ferredoxin:NAD+ oxidoreductase RnfD subunit
MNNYTYLNAYESSHTLKYDILDYLFGKGPGGISNTLLIATILIGVILICNRQYKKHIVISFLLTNIIFNIISMFITKDISLATFINNNVLFAIVFVAPLSLFSPYTRGGCYIYGILLAIICFVASFWDVNIGLYIGVCLLSLLTKVLDRPFVR